jgi:hypothetical protein
VAGICRYGCFGQWYAWRNGVRWRLHCWWLPVGSYRPQNRVRLIRSAPITLLYAFITGLTYAGFSAVVFEAIGITGAATKYTLFAALSNLPIGYMTFVDGWAATRWGPGGMLFAEAAICVASVLLFIAVAAVGTKRTAHAVWFRLS